MALDASRRGSEHRTSRRAPAIGLGTYPLRATKPPSRRRLLVLPDSENDTQGVRDSLRFAGLLGKRGNIKKRMCGVHIVQTGDLLHKHAPDPAVVDFWNGLRSAADTAGCSLHLVAGNHELEIWRRLRSGERLGLRRREQRAVEELIRTMRLYHVEGSMLFIHGYPTVKLLRHIQAVGGGNGKDLNDYNADCFQPALDAPGKLAQYAYRRAQGRGSLLHDVPDPARYYRRHGAEVAALLAGLGIDLVIHGHRPERSGVQADFECSRWLPGIRMIGHDIQLRVRGLGATAISQVENGPAELRFVNRANTSSAHRSDVRRLLQDPDRLGPAPVQAEPAIQRKMAASARDSDWRLPTMGQAARAFHG